MCQKIAKSRIQKKLSLISSDISKTPYLSFDIIVTSCEQKSVYNTGFVSLLRRDLNNLVNSWKYNSSVEDVYAFVKVFNERNPYTNYG